MMVYEPHEKKEPDQNGKKVLKFKKIILFIKRKKMIMKRNSFIQIGTTFYYDFLRNIKQRKKEKKE